MTKTYVKLNTNTLIHYSSLSSKLHICVDCQTPRGICLPCDREGGQTGIHFVLQPQTSWWHLEWGPRVLVCREHWPCPRSAPGWLYRGQRPELPRSFLIGRMRRKEIQPIWEKQDVDAWLVCANTHCTLWPSLSPPAPSWWTLWGRSTAHGNTKR